MGSYVIFWLRMDYLWMIIHINQTGQRWLKVALTFLLIQQQQTLFFTIAWYLTMYRISIARKNVSYARKREGINQRLSIVDCGPLCHTEKLIDTLHTMLAVWVVCTNDFRGIWRTALSIKWKCQLYYTAHHYKAAWSNHSCQSRNNFFPEY